MDQRTSWLSRVWGQDSENVSEQSIENGAVWECQRHAGKVRRETLGTWGCESECVLVALGNQSDCLEDKDDVLTRAYPGRTDDCPFEAGIVSRNERK